MENISKKYDVIIAGGGVAGLTAAIYTARAGRSVIVLEAGYHGGQIVNAGSVENYPGIRRIPGFELAQNVYEQAVALGAECVHERVIQVVKQNSGEFEVVTDGDKRRTAGAVIIATGTAAKTLDIPGEEKFKGKGVSYCGTCDGGFYKGRTVAVAGGGNSALGEALHLSEICDRVYLIHRRDSFRAEAHLTSLVEKKDNIECIMNSSIEAVNGSDVVEAIEVSDNGKPDGRNRMIDVSCLFVSIGYEPKNKVFAGLIELDRDGYVAVGENCHTSCEGVYAAGDCRVKKVRQIVTAVADGAVSAIEACEYVRQLHA